MTDAVTEDDYNEEVAVNAQRLVDYAREDVERDTAYEDEEQAVLDLVSDVLHGHEWWGRDYYDLSLYACIIQHRQTDPSRFNDVHALIEGSSPDRVVKDLAYLCFEADVLEAALSALEGGGEGGGEADAALSDTPTERGSDADEL